MIEDRRYRITFTEQLLGGSPMNKTIYTDYVASKAPPETGDDEVQGELDLVRDGQKGMTGFLGDEEGIYLMDYQIKGFLKEAGNILKANLGAADGKSGKAKGVKALKSKIDNYVYVFPRYIPLADKPDGLIERPLRAETMQGPRVTLACSEYVEAGKQIEITISLVSHQDLNFDIIEQLLDFGRLKGMCQWRNGGYGRFIWERMPDEEGPGKAVGIGGSKNLLRKAV